MNRQRKSLKTVPLRSYDCSHWQQTFSAKPLKSRQVDGNKKSVMTEMRLLIIIANCALLSRRLPSVQIYRLKICSSGGTSMSLKYPLNLVTRTELSALKHGVKNGLVPVRILGYVGTCMFVSSNYIYVRSVRLFWGP